MSYLRLQGIEKRFGAVSVIRGVDISAEKGEFVVFVGPSGCGKSTLLRMIAGLEEVSGGDVFIDGARVTYAEPAKRQVSMVFQSCALFPRMSVRDDIAFDLRADLSESLGGATLIHGQSPAGETASLQVPGRRMLGKGEGFSVGIDAAQAYAFDGASLAI